MVHLIALPPTPGIPPMPDPTALIAATDTAVRTNLQKFADSFFWKALLSSAIVVIGVTLEGPELLNELWPRTFSYFANRWVKKVGLIGWLFVVLGVGGEVFFGLMENRAQDLLQTFNEIMLSDAQRNAGSARVSAIAAANAATLANSESERAASSSGEAMALAQGARKEADAYTEEIASAKNEAADAESRLAGAERQLADATQREANAETELSRLKMPRSLVGTGQLISAIKPFRGTQYLLEVSENPEAIQLTKDIGRALDAAGWIRKEPASHNIGVTYLNVFSDDAKDAVPVCIRTGIEVSLKTTESIGSLQARPARYLPRRVKAAIALRSALVPSIYPPDEHNVKEQVRIDKDPGQGPITICVGQKP